MTDEYLLSGHKLYWHLDRVNDWIKGQPIVPIYIDMGITQTCNIACKYCYYAVPEKRTDKIIPTDRLISFLETACEVGVKAIGFLGDGEPMIHPGVYDAVIAGANVGLDMAISTNGLLMKKNRLKDFLNALTWIRFTISAASPINYGKIMGTNPDIFHKVIDNIKNCIQIKKKFNLKVTIGLQMVLIDECADEILAFTKMGKEIGVDYVVIKQCSEKDSVQNNLVVADYNKFESRFCEAESYSDDGFNVIIKRRKMLNKKRQYERCYGCAFLPQITGSGDVYNCGNFFGNKKFLIGNIIKQSFKDIAFGDRYFEVMKLVDSVDVHTQCGINCRQNEMNEFLWMLKAPPEHINFI